MQTGVISQAAGSAYAELGRTKVMVAVYGPRPAVRAVNVYVPSLPLLCHSLEGLLSRREETGPI